MNNKVDVNTIGTGRIKFGLEYRDLLSDQGVCINVFGEVDGEYVELLRFDCFDNEPHYHYGPENQNERLMLDVTTEGDSLDWVLNKFSERLPEMIERAGYQELSEDARSMDMSGSIDELSAAAKSLSVSGRKKVMHDLKHCVEYVISPYTVAGRSPASPVVRKEWDYIGQMLREAERTYVNPNPGRGARSGPPGEGKRRRV